MRVLVLGLLELGDGGPALAPRDRVVLSALLLRWGKPASTEQLAEVLWGERLPASWLKVVHGCVSRLRHRLGADAIETVPTGYRVVRRRLDLDRVEFEELVGRARDCAACAEPQRAAVLLEQALALWRGRPFPELDDWPAARWEADRLEELRCEAVEDLLQAQLDGGDHLAVAASATAAVGEQPWRERRWAILALAQYRSDRQADALASLHSARQALGDELGIDPCAELADLERAILQHDPGLTPVLAPGLGRRPASTVCPWREVSPYGRDDLDFFLGRDDEVALVLDRLEQLRLLVLCGPSGCGTTSLMLAGVGSALRRRGHGVTSFSPGGDPHAAMTAARACVGGDPILLVDQLEEALGDAGPDGGHASASGDWLHELVAYARSTGRVVATLRPDHLRRLTEEPVFAALATDGEGGVHLVPPLSGEALRAVVEEPARRAGLWIEHGLVDLALRDADVQPGALPLLSQALVETWRRREGTLLTVDGYLAGGGLRGSLAASAERLHESLAPAEQRHLRQVMLRLVTPGEGAEPPWGALPHGALDDDADRAHVLDLLVRRRVVTITSDRYVIAHDALPRDWPRLRTWLDEDLPDRLVLRHLSATATGWQTLGRPDSELYRGVRLQAATRWLASPDAGATTLEREFLESSAAVARRAQPVAQEQARRDRRRRGTPLVLLVLVGLLALVGLVGLVGLVITALARHT